MEYYNNRQTKSQEDVVATEENTVVNTAEAFARVGEALLYAQTRARKADERAERMERLLRNIINNNEIELFKSESSLCGSTALLVSRNLSESLIAEDWELLQSFMSEQSLRESNPSLSSSSLDNPENVNAESNQCIQNAEENDLYDVECVTTVTADVIASLKQTTDHLDDEVDIPPSPPRSILEMLRAFLVKKFTYLSGQFPSSVCKPVKRLLESRHLLEILAGMCAGFALGALASGQSQRRIIHFQDRQIQRLASQVCRLQAQLETKGNLSKFAMMGYGPSLSLNALLLHHPQLL